MTARDRDYDRVAASRVLAELAAPGLFTAGLEPGAEAIGGSRRIEYTASAMAAEPGSHLTLSQRMYLERFMQPCRPEQVTSATHRITWTDSDGIPNTGHYGSGPHGPLVPIVVRETVLALWRDLAANARLTDAALDLSDADFATLAATTTDQEPMEIFRIGIEATGRALAQHALVAHHVRPSATGPQDAAARFARAMRGSGLFASVAHTWFWELQASTYRRGMIPAALEQAADGRLRYSADTVAVLAAMKQQTVTDAHETMRRAIEVEGLTAAQAVHKYHTDLDLISKQYALMDPDTQPRCLAWMPNVVDGRRVSVLSMAVDAFVATFVRMLDLVEIAEVPAVEPAADAVAGEADRRFHVPDMNCRHCRVTITAVLESHGVEVADISLVTKQVVARFDTIHQRDNAFAAIRDSGYTVVTDRAG